MYFLCHVPLACSQLNSEDEDEDEDQDRVVASMHLNTLWKPVNFADNSSLV